MFVSSREGLPACMEFTIEVLVECVESLLVQQSVFVACEIDVEPHL